MNAPLPIPACAFLIVNASHETEVTPAQPRTLDGHGDTLCAFLARNRDLPPDSAWVAIKQTFTIRVRRLVLIPVTG